MMEQLSFDKVIQGRFYDRDGRIKECPEWVKDRRCGNCQHWQILDVYDQPPCGWQVRGLCGSPEGRNEYTTAQTSFCEEWEAKGWMQENSIRGSFHQWDEACRADRQ